MALALDELKDNDDSYETGGLTYLIDKELSTKLGEVKVDFIEQGWRSGFTITSERPLNVGASACGTSCSC